MVCCEFAAHSRVAQNLCVFGQKISCRSLFHKKCLGNCTEPNANRGRAPTSGLLGESEVIETKVRRFDKKKEWFTNLLRR